ncbi:MAG: ammonium transporter [Saprospiraceae bacterium]
MSRKLALVPFSILIIIVILSLIHPSIPAALYNGEELNTGDTAWMITATALVLFMTPGLAFFYGGMVRKKNVISTMAQSFISMAVITILWFIIGFSLAFGDSIGGIIGNPGTFFMMGDVLGSKPWSLAPTIPLILFALFQLKFAIITPALITGAFAERVKFTSYILFIVLWSIMIYSPLCHMTWHPDGFFFKLGVLDFAGGTVVHMSAGWAAFASALFFRSRSTGGLEPARITYVLLGTALLWFGWLGFNGGSAFGANALASSALATTTGASAAAAFTWIIFDTVRGRKPSAMGAAIGAVVGLVAITPAAGFVSLPHSLTIGIVAALVSNFMIELRTSKTNIDDTLDVFPCHGVGGMVGMVLTGVFASKNINSAGANGLFFGETHLFFTHLIALVIVSLFAFFGTALLLRIVNMITPMRVSAEEEEAGLDLSQHGEKL